MIRSVRWTFLFGLVALTAAGCGPSTGSVSGNVTFEGAGIPMGNITFVPPKGDSVPGTIQDGKYYVENVPLGEATVTVSVPMAIAGGGPPGKGGPGWEKKGPPKDAPVPAGFDPSKANKASTVKIPAQYGDAKTTPLKYTVIAGKQTKDFEIE